MKKILLILVAYSVILVSCVSSKVQTREVMDSWVGHTKQELLMSWGPPARVSSDGAGGEIIVYARQVYIPPQTSTFYDSYGGSSTSTLPAVNYWDYRMFWINKDGIVYHWMTQRQQVPPQHLNLDVYIK